MLSNKLQVSTTKHNLCHRASVEVWQNSASFWTTDKRTSRIASCCSAFSLKLILCRPLLRFYCQWYQFGKSIQCVKLRALVAIGTDTFTGDLRCQIWGNMVTLISRWYVLLILILINMTALARVAIILNAPHKQSRNWWRHTRLRGLITYYSKLLSVRINGNAIVTCSCYL
jgi:hypothetical protein